MSRSGRARCKCQCTTTTRLGGTGLALHLAMLVVVVFEWSGYEVPGNLSLVRREPVHHGGRMACVFLETAKHRAGARSGHESHPVAGRSRARGARRRGSRRNAATPPPEIAAHAAPAQLMNVRSEALHSREVTALSTTDSPAVFAVKSLLLPIIPVITLSICMAATDTPLRGGYFLIAVLTFLGAPDVLGLARIGVNDEKRPQGEVLLEITARWLTLVALIAAVVHLAGLAPTIDYGLLLIWFAVTPAVLFVGQWGARRWLTHILLRRLPQR